MVLTSVAIYVVVLLMHPNPDLAMRVTLMYTGLLIFTAIYMTIVSYYAEKRAKEDIIEEANAPACGCQTGGANPRVKRPLQKPLEHPLGGAK